MKKKIIAISLISATTIAVALTPGGPAETLTITEIAGMTTASIGAITAFGTSFAASTQFNFERIISAIAIATKQEGLNGSTISQSMQKSSQTIISALKAQKQADKTVSATFDYSPATGQGFEPCQTMTRNQTLSSAYSDIDKGAGVEMTEIDADNRPGFVVESTNESLARRTEQHYKMFCTEQEAQKGLCKESDLPGADLNAGFLFEPSAKNSQKDIARQAYIENIMGNPDENPMKGKENQIDANIAFNEKIRKDSINSIPAYTLQSIRLANLQQENYANNSPNQLLKARVNQYFGGDEANKWAGSLASQTPRGLMVEQIKMQGLESWIHQRQYQQNQRLEANLAALLLIQTKKKQAKLNQAYSDLLNEGK